MISVSSEMNDIILLTLKGKLVSSDDVEEMYLTIKDVISKDHKKIILDLKNVNWISSLGIGSLMRSLTTVKNSGGDLRLASVSQKIKKIFSITKLDNVFQLYGNLDEAIKSFN
ncbi:MAG: anti-sigma factor antagonist [Calditrichaeota bacterium]|nr:MAG: anti-sigma factor antagonist [Calditrichota bacterium]